MRKIIKYSVWAFSAVLLTGCDDILEEDITDKMIVTISPQNGQVIESNVAVFQWNEINGADNYRVQVYSSTQSMVLDSLVNSTNFTFGLNPGAYQWRVRGENFAYETAYTFPAAFTMVETDDLTNQVVQLVSPASGIYVQNNAMVFSWVGVSAAQHYNFQLVNTAGSTVIHQENEITATNFTLNTGIITQDGTYQWRVQAVNPENETQTQFSTRNFYVDTVVPNQPLNTLPANNALADVGEEITFEWAAPNDAGPVASPLTYTIQIATDTNFNNVIFSDTTNFTTFDYTFSAEDEYYWRVRAVDGAGNEGAFSAYFKVTVNE
jgi:hypothetical protein